ncbi:hypothetical protein [Fulvitalea axinellae]|uniref:hypothetical protein n=1 Tax=Fulvitalea axinellae TaxID=1182444 RepID=UPI0030CA3F48
MFAYHIEIWRRSAVKNPQEYGHKHNITISGLNNKALEGLSHLFKNYGLVR